MTLKNGFGKCSLDALSANGWKDQNMASSFSRQKTPNMENAMFDWPIVLQHDAKVKYRLISRKFLGHEVFSPERSLNQPKATRVCIRSINQSNRSISVRLLFLFCSRVSISRSNENRSIRAQSLSPLCKSFQFSVLVRSRFQALLYPLASWWGGHSPLENLRRLQFNAPRFTQRRLNHKISLQSVLGVSSSRLNAKMKV